MLFIITVPVRPKRLRVRIAHDHAEESRRDDGDRDPYGRQLEDQLDPAAAMIPDTAEDQRLVGPSSRGTWFQTR